MSSPLVSDVTDSTFAAEVLQADQPVLVDFWASWCAPCVRAAPIVEQVAEQVVGKTKVVKVNIDENPQVAQQFRVMSLPTFAVFSGGVKVAELVGTARPAQLLELAQSAAR